MEITFGLIVLAIFILAIALAWIVCIENPRKASEYRMNERRNMIELIKGIKPVTTATFVALPDYDSDTYDFTWNVIHIERSLQPVAQATPQAVAQPIDIVENQTPVYERLGIARQIVSASLAKTTINNQLLPGSHFKSQKVWQRGIDSLHDRGWVRADNSGTYPAIGHDLNWLMRQIESALNLSSGVSALPQAMPYDDRIKLAGNGNGNTARE